MKFKVLVSSLVVLNSWIHTAECQTLPPTDVLVQFTGLRTFTAAWVPPAAVVGSQEVIEYILAYNGGSVQVPADRTYVEVVSPDEVNPNQFAMGLYSRSSAGYSITEGFTILQQGDPRLPPSPTGTKRLTGPTTILLEWTTPVGDFDTYRLIYSNDGHDEATVTLPADQFSYEVVDVSGQFYMNLYTLKNGIRSDVGVWVLNTTSEDAPPPPRNLLLQQTDPQSFTLAWTPPEEPVEGYILRYSLDDDQEQTTILLNNTLTNIHITCDFLITHQFRIGFVSVRNNLHSTNAEANVVTTGHELLPPSPVVTQRLLSPTEVLLELSSPADFDVYNISVYKSYGVLSKLLGKRISEYLVDWISPGGQTKVSVAIVTNGIISDPTTVIVPDPNVPKPNPPLNVTRHNLNRSTIVLNWATPSTPFDQYYLDVRRDGARLASDLTHWSIPLSKNVSSFVFSDAKRRERYLFTVYSALGDYDSFGDGVVARSVPRASAKSAVSFGAITQHAMEVRWQMVSNATSYRLTLINSAGDARVAVIDDIEVDATAGEHLFLGLAEGMTYKAIVDASIGGEMMVMVGWTEMQTAKKSQDSILVVGYPPSTLDLVWPPTANATGYTVSMVSSTGEDVRVIPTAGDTIMITVYDIQNEMPYEIGIRAHVDGTVVGVGGVSHVIAKDSQAPLVISCPSDINKTVPINSGGGKVNWLQPEAIDDSALVPWSEPSHAPGDEFPVGKTDVSYVFTDHSGNEAVCEFTVRIMEIDSEPPVVDDCPFNFTKSVYAHLYDAKNGLPIYWTEPRAQDNSGQVILTSQTHKPGSGFQTGQTVVAYEYRDPAGNVATCSFTIVVILEEDLLPPAIILCPDNINETIELGAPGVLVDWYTPEATDSVGPVRLISVSHEQKSVFRDGVTPVTYIFADGANNTAACGFIVTVETIDTQPPTIIQCPSDINRTTPGFGGPGVVVRWLKPQATDISDLPLDMSATHRSGRTFPGGRTNVTYSFTDASNNTSVCEFAVIIHEVPTATEMPTTTTQLPTTTTQVPTTTMQLPTTTTQLPTTTTQLPTTTTEIPTTTTQLPTTTTKLPTTTTEIPTTTTQLPTTTAKLPTTKTEIPTTTTQLPTTTTKLPTTTTEISTTTTQFPTTTTPLPTTTKTQATTTSLVTSPTITSTWPSPTIRTTPSVEITSLHETSSDVASTQATTPSDNITTVEPRVTLGNLPEALTAGPVGVCDCYVDAAYLALMSGCLLPSSCDADRLLANMTEIPVNSENLENFSGALRVISTGHATISAVGIIYFADVLENIVAVNVTSTTVASNVIVSTNNILKVSNDDFQLVHDSSSMSNSRIIHALRRLLAQAHDDNQNFIQSESNILAWTVDMPRNTIVTYTVRQKGADVVTLERRGRLVKRSLVEQDDELIASMSIPSVVHENETATDHANSHPAIFTFYNNTKLFQSSLDKEEPVDINSGVISASVAGATSESMGLHREPVLITLKPWNEYNNRESECVFWNQSLKSGDGFWSTDGCLLTETQDSGHIVCSCDHLGHFALRLTPKIFVIGIITFAGCVLCIGIMTAATMISLSIWAKVPHRTVINLCISLLFLSGLFLGGINQIHLGGGIGCTVIAALIQYFLLVSLSWAAVESLNLVWQVVAIRTEFINRYIVRVFIGCWGAPLLFVADSRVIVYLLTDSWTENNKFCFLNPGIALYTGVVAPLALILVFHLYVVALMMRKGLCSRYGCSDRSIMHAIQRCKVSLPICLLTTACSVVGYFMLINVDSYVLRAVFSVLALIDGAYLLAGVYCLGKKDLLDMRCSSCCRIRIGKRSAYHVQKEMVGKKLYRNNGSSGMTAQQTPFGATRFTRVGTFQTQSLWKGEDV